MAVFEENIECKFDKMKELKFVVADIGISIRYRGDLSLESELYSFKNFRTAGFDANQPIIYFELIEQDFKESKDDYKLLSDISIVWGDNFKFLESEDSYLTIIDEVEIKNGKVWKMVSEKTFIHNKIYFNRNSLVSSSALSWLVMVAFGQASLRFNTVLIHSSVVYNNEEAVAFLGKSGTGKSTHSRLWLKHIDGFKLLNDDNPAVKITEEGEAYIFGTPWSGKTVCYVNQSAKLKAIVRLQQAPFNRFSKKKGKDALMTLLPSFTALRWNKDIFSKMISLIENIITNVNVGHLECLPDEDAAKINYESITKY